MGIASILLANKIRQGNMDRMRADAQPLLGNRGTAASLGGHPGMQDVTIPGQAGSGLLAEATPLEENQLRLALRMATNPATAAGGNALLTQYFGKGQAADVATTAHGRALELQGNRINAQNMRSQNQLQQAQLQRQADMAFQVHLADYQKQLQAGYQWDTAARNTQAEIAGKPWMPPAEQQARRQALGPRPQATIGGLPQNGAPQMAPGSFNQAPPAPGTPPIEGTAARTFPLGERPSEPLAIGDLGRGYKRVRVDGELRDVPMPGQPEHTKAQTEMDTRSKLVDVISEMSDKLDESGPDYAFSSAAEYNALYAQFQAGMAQLLELGVLQEGEAERLEERLPNPASFGSNFMTLPSTVRAGYAQVLKGAKADLERAKSKYKGYGLTSGPPGQAPGGWNYAN